MSLRDGVSLFVRPRDFDAAHGCPTPPAGFLAAYKNLRMIGTVTAGVDKLVADPDLPPGVPIVRGGDPEGDGQITENIILHVLRHHRQLPAYAAAQARAEWVRLDQKLTKAVVKKQIPEVAIDPPIGISFNGSAVSIVIARPSSSLIETMRPTSVMIPVNMSVS